MTNSKKTLFPAATALLVARRAAPVAKLDLSHGGQIELGGSSFITPRRLADMLHVTVRTLSRWHAQRIGPPRTKVGKLVLIPVEKLPSWLSSRECGPARGHIKGAAQ